MAKLTGEQDFRWARDGERLLREREPWFYSRPPLPSVTVLPRRLTEWKRSQRER